jgi:hypothetical protein
MEMFIVFRFCNLQYLKEKLVKYELVFYQFINISSIIKPYIILKNYQIQNTIF